MKMKTLILLLAVGCVLSACSASAETDTNIDSENTDEIIDEVATDSVDNEWNSGIVTTGQSATYDNDGNIIETEIGDSLYGQDGDYESTEFSFTLNDDGTTYDNNTGLTWITIPDGGKMTWEEAVEYCENLTVGGYDDWRLPTVEELFSISDFEEGWPYIDTDYFSFDASLSSSSSISKEGGQYWSCQYNLVEGDDRLGDIAFGVNHVTGHVKAYTADSDKMGKYVRAVRGDIYGEEEYTDNGDGTVTDNESGLMWMSSDLGVAVDWEDALSLAESYEYAGYDDWRLPDVKELQSIVNYDGSYPAVDQDYFSCTVLEENENYYFWTSTSAYFSTSAPDYNSAWYVAFGYTSHGAGAVRFSPKYEGSDALSEGSDNILNSVRLVRTITDEE